MQSVSNERQTQEQNVLDAKQVWILILRKGYLRWDILSKMCFANVNLVKFKTNISLLMETAI